MMQSVNDSHLFAFGVGFVAAILLIIALLVISAEPSFSIMHLELTCHDVPLAGRWCSVN